MEDQSTLKILLEAPIETYDEGPLSAYRTIRSGTCESNGLKMIASKEECQVVVDALNELGFNSGVNRYNGAVIDWKVNNLYNLLAPFGCLYTDNTEDGVYWSEPIIIQSSMQCGSKNQAKQYFCFCKKKSNL